MHQQEEEKLLQHYFELNITSKGISRFQICNLAEWTGGFQRFIAFFSQLLFL